MSSTLGFNILATNNKTNRTNHNKENKVIYKNKGKYKHS